MEPHELAARAADYIEEHGHTKFILEDAKGRVCLNGAIIKAGGGSCAPRALVSIPDGWRATMLLVENYLGGPIHPVDWNNAPERTQDEVVAVLRAVAGQRVPVDAHDQELAR